jgi:hypothetical protein
MRNDHGREEVIVEMDVAIDDDRGRSMSTTSTMPMRSASENASGLPITPRSISVVT